MDKALEIGRDSASGSFQLFIGRAVSTVVLAVGTIILGWLILPEEYGLYSIALIPATTISLFQDWGVGSAITRFSASLRTTDKADNLRSTIVAGLYFEIATGLAMSLILLIMANFIASAIFHRPEIAPLISIASITVFSTSLLTASQCSFIGFERMGLNSLVMVCHAIVQSIASPLLVFLGYGASGAVLGCALAYLVACVLGITMLHFTIVKKIGGNSPTRSEVLRTLKTMLRYGIPLSISSILAGLLVQIYGFMMASFCNDVMIGNYKITTNFAILLTFFTIPIATVLFPTFAKLDPGNEHELLRTVFTSSIKYTTLLLVPAAVAMMVLSEPMIGTLFGDKWLYAPAFLTLYVMVNLFAAVGSLSMTSFLVALGKTKMLMKLNMLTLLIGIPLAFLLIPAFGIVGVILGNTFSGVPSMLLALRWISRNYRAKADFESSAKIIFASLIAATTTYLFLVFFNVADWINLIAGGIIFLTIYIITAPLIGAINQTDINNLRTMLSGLGIVSRILEIPLTLLEKTARHA